VGRKTLLIIILVAIAGLLAANVFLNKSKNLSISQSQQPQSVPQTEIPPVEASQLISVDSPDGTQTISMKTSKNSGMTTYSFTIGGKEVFTDTVDPSISFLIPENTFSPDNKYVFLKETGNAGSSFFALTASGDSSTQNDQTANITSLFAAKYPNLKIEDATGWGGIDLIVFNTLNADGSRGPSFWFEMPSHAIIQLANRF
jgi:hypothetical protein